MCWCGGVVGLLTLHETGVRRRVLGHVHHVGLRVEGGRVLVHVQHVQPRHQQRRRRRTAAALRYYTWSISFTFNLYVKL